jgi:2-iminobutanoate/2-iminopropanoate deaminase
LGSLLPVKGQPQPAVVLGRDQDAQGRCHLKAFLFELSVAFLATTPLPRTPKKRQDGTLRATDGPILQFANDATGEIDVPSGAFPFRQPRGIMASRALSPTSIKAPFARYSHGIAVPAGHRLVFTSGQLGIRDDGTVPVDAEAQADLCFANIAAILAEDGMTLANIVRLNAYVTAREHMQGYMRSRDRQFPQLPPSSTLMIVTGFTRPEFVVEIEAVASAPG